VTVKKTGSEIQQKPGKGNEESDLPNESNKEVKRLSMRSQKEKRKKTLTEKMG